MAAPAAIVNCKSNVYDGNRHNTRCRMKSEEEWANEVKRMLRAEMTRRGVTYDQLAEKLAAIGVNDTAVNIRNKVARGKFTAVFLAQCLEAMGVRSLRLGEPEGGE
jgi:hypothetical protein